MRYVKFFLGFVSLIIASSCNESDVAQQSVGQGGSTARYAIQGNFLYVVDDINLSVFAIGNGAFKLVKSLEAGFGVETVFARPAYLYLGAADGMYMYSLDDPANPSFVFRYEHILACDPVVVQGNRAYITMSSYSEFCNRSINGLDIVDITDHYNPRLIARHNLQSPRGLGVDGSLLFVAEGPYGFKVLDISDEHNIKVIREVNSLNCNDVIVTNKSLTITGQDGILQYQYDRADPASITLLSKIPVSL